jgi:hypothetical protein
MMRGDTLIFRVVLAVRENTRWSLVAIFFLLSKKGRI